MIFPLNNVFLFGGSGFLGPVILEKYPEIVSVGRTQPPEYVQNQHIMLDNFDDFSILDEEKIDYVVFLVGNSNHHRLNLSSSTLALEYNLIPLSKALNYFSGRKIKKFICLSGALIYDELKTMLPADENQPIDPYRNNYLFSKYLAEETTRLFQDKVPIINIRISNIYGPTKLVRPDLVPTLVQQVLSPNVASVWNMAPKRDWLYTKDAAEAIINLLNTDYTGILNLGTGVASSVGEVAKVLERLSGKKIIDLKKKVSGPMLFHFDISLINGLTGWRPKYTLSQGLEETFNRMKGWADECLWWEGES